MAPPIVVTLVICLLHAAAGADVAEPISPSIAPKTHLIKFVGLKHGYPSDEIGGIKFIDNLRKITGGHHVILDRLDSNGATWHSANITQCAEPEVRDLLATIQGPDGLFERDYKILFGEKFVYPTRIEVEWLGPCANIDRKRDQPQAGAVSSLGYGEASTTLSFISDTISNAPNDSTPVVTSENDTTTTTTTTTATTIEPTKPTSTTETPTTFPAQLERSDDADEANVSSSFTTMKPLTFDLLFPDDKTGDGNVLTNMSLSNDRTTPTTTLDVSTAGAIDADNTSRYDLVSTSSTIDSSASLAQDTTTPTETTISTTPTTLTTVTNLLDEGQMIGATGEPIIEAISVNSIGGQQSGSAKLNNNTEASNRSSNERQYGKYVGLGAGFLVFIAYLVCARAYRRQGAYELHES